MRNDGRKFFGVDINADEDVVINALVKERGVRSRSDLARRLFGEEAVRRGITLPPGAFHQRRGQQVRTKISDATRAEILAMAAAGKRTSIIAQLFDLPACTVSNIRNGRDYHAERCS